MRPLDSTVSLDPTDSCMPFYPPSTRPRARQVIEKIKRQASALVKSPSKRVPPYSCTSPLQVPTVTFVAASPVQSSFSGRASSVSYSHYDNAILHIDAPPASDVLPYHLVSRLERETPHPSSPSAQAPTLTPLSNPTPKFSAVSPPSPSASERSDSTSSIPSPVTPVFSGHHDVHPYASSAATSKRWSVGSYEQDQSNNPFTKAKVQIVRRSLIQDHFLMACAAVDDPTPVEDNVHGTRSPKGKPSAFGKKSNASLPPSKPPPSCPLPSPPSGCLESSYSIHSVFDCPSVADQEWTLFLGVPSKPLEVLNIKAEPRKRAGSLPVPSYLLKQHLSPTDIPPQVQPRVRTFSSFSTQSHATGRRIESGPADADGVVFDWTLSLPVIKKPKSSLNIQAFATSPGIPVRVNTRKCKSFTDWTVNLATPHERQEIRLRERERKLERASHISIVSTASARATSHPSVKRLPTGPESTLPQIHLSHSINASPTNLDHSITESMTSLHSATSSASSTKLSYKDSLPFDPCSPDIAPVSPTAPSFSNYSTYADSLFISNARPPSLASTSTPSIANFPLPPSFSHKLAQRRLAAPPMPGPLRSVYADHSHASTSAALPMVSSLSSADFETHVATSAPATSLHFSPCLFPSDPSRSLEKGRPGLYYNRPSTSTSVDSQNSNATTISAASSKNSMRTASSASTIIAKTRTPMLKVNIADVQTEHQVNGEPPSPLLCVSAIAEEACYDGFTRPSFESSTMTTEYYTCNEDGLSDEEVASLRKRCSPVETDENSEHYHSARSSLDF